MTSPPVRTRSFVMVLVGWMTLASAAVVALSAPATAAFVVLAIGLVAVTTPSLLVFALAGVAGPLPPWALGSEDLLRLLRSLVRWQTLQPDLLAAVALAGTAGCAELASAGLEWDLVLRGAVGRQRQVEDLEPAGEGRNGAANGTMPRAEQTPRSVRHREEA